MVPTEHFGTQNDFNSIMITEILQTQIIKNPILNETAFLTCFTLRPINK